MHRLERLLRPRSIAVFGGSFAANVVQQCRKMGFAGEVWPVHPTKPEVHGVKAYRGVDDLPGVPDAAFVGVNRLLTIDIVRQLRERGAGGAICFAAGFLEAGADDADGARLQDELLAAAGDMPIIGPNCYGLINYADGALLWPDQHGGERLEGGRGVAILTQSSNIAINMTMQKRGLPLAYVMTAGNQAQTGLSELALGLIEDERVSALGLHIEGFDSVTGLEKLAARARELRKPIVAMKVGRSEQARAGALSHTASLAGSDAASDAFMRRLGIARVDSIPAFLETLKLLHVCGPLPGNKLSSMSCSGGEASVMADAAEGRPLVFPKLDDAHRASVKETLGPLVAVANPLDYHTFIWNNEDAMRQTFTAMVSDRFDLNALVLDFPRNDRCSDADWQPTLRAFRAALTAKSARGAVVASMPENMPEGEAKALVAQGVVPLFGIGETMDAVEAAHFIGAAWSKPASTAVGDRAALVGETQVLDEATAKALLREDGLNVPAGIVAASVADAVDAAGKIGFPLALKALGVAHKSETGAVRLNLRDADTVRSVAEALLPLGTGLFVEKMIEGGVAELIVGITHDALFGPVMTIGTGGVLVELLQDSATLLLPASRDEIERALRGLKMFPLLEGYRGRPKADLRAAIEAIAKIGAFAQAENIEELDINPLIVCGEGKGAWIADALLVRRTQ
ncbi:MULTISPECIES: acetate--CoA ligase family protein [Mesorhizobium]|uniref:CoA-binding protein n=1 Tax=Mesorhizobium denitrificans TaxID=2294114 RepID=A0A371XH44_9HYPH|nr:MULTISPECIES: acetate--CoA ligase family protein [Mesorhizobium]RFC68555.1 CoA-binding protein [Mesorhizobium denitrificans]